MLDAHFYKFSGNMKMLLVIFYSCHNMFQISVAGSKFYCKY